MKLCRAIQVGLFTTTLAAGWLLGQGPGSLAQTQPAVSSETRGLSSPRKENAPTKQSGTLENQHTTGLVTAGPQTTEFAIAEDIATVLAKGQETGPHGETALRVMPMAGNGGARNVTDILTLAGADMTIAPVILVERLRDGRTLGDLRSKLVYIAPLFTEEFHLLARPEMTSVADLAGQKVNLGEAGSPGAVLGRELLALLDVKIDEVNIGLEAALEAVSKGQISATLLVSGKPVSLLSRYTPANGVHLLPIQISPELQHDFQQANLDNQDYPNLIATGESVETVAVKSALFAYNWPSRSERFRLLELFVQSLFSRFPEFLGDAHHPKWREVDLSASLPGWQRFRPAERWLQQQVSGQTSLRNAFNRFIEQKSVSNPAQREELFRQFLRWRERRQDQ
jgi:uncharacterized protein